MAITGSGLFCATLMDVLDTTQLALDLDLETHKGALFSNSLTPNYTTNASYAVSPFDANEVTGTNWPSGGVALTGTGLSAASGIVTFDATDVSVASTTITNARGYVLYADALTNNNLILLIDFTSDFSTVNGTFSIIFNASGIATLDLVP
jgi:hypothetical protein